jgi:hypothetical protein
MHLCKIGVNHAHVMTQDGTQVGAQSGCSYIGLMDSILVD